MICLFDWQEMPDTGILTRIRSARRVYKGFRAGETVVLGMRVMHVTIDISPEMPLKTIRKRIGCAAELMRAKRAGKVLFFNNFPYREHVLWEGFDEMNEERLTEQLAGKIASAFAGGDKVAALFARRLTGEAERVFSALCRDFKYIMAAVEADEGRLYQALGKKLGISVIGHPTEKQLLKADVAVFFSPPTCQTVLPDKCVAIPVNKEAMKGVVCRRAVSGLTVELPDGRMTDIPKGFAPEPLITAAIEAGTLDPGEIMVRSLEFSDMYV
ncbi:MAG: hypothetical protein GX847_00825 [Clostridiales bacterium]|nr:hypothetical protein [Clostridiales bacterium]